jgi:signal transduction histidine kinase/HD-like signal output (HDOD) protein
MTTAMGARPTHQTRSRERVELILSQLDRLPTLPAVAARLLAVTTSNKSSLRDVVQVIESDASLTAGVLRLVRRADLGVRSRGLTVARAVALLGFNAVRNAVLSVQLYETFSQSRDRAKGPDLREGLWQHGIGVACAAEMIGERVGGPDFGAEAFMCGLLHDVGKVALDACLPKGFARVVEDVERRERCICDAEREVFGLDHTVAGRHLAARWRLPEAVIECVWLHHQDPLALPSSVAHGRLVAIVHLADDLIRRAGIGFSGYGHVGDVEAAAAALGVGADQLAALIEQLPDRIDPFREMIGLGGPDGGTDYTASLVAANRQLGRFNARLTEENRRLKGRSACLGAVARFIERLSDRDRIGDVCVAAADALRAMLEAHQTVAFFADDLSGCVYAGVSADPDQDGTALVLEPSDSCGDAVADWLKSVPPAARLVTAPPDGEDFWQRCAGPRPDGPLWLLPVAGSHAVVGGVLVCLPDQTPLGPEAASTEWEALSGAISLAWLSARARRDTDRTSEELLDLNRRLGAAQKELVRARSISMIAKMAAGAAHELNNPLTVISGRAQLELNRASDADTQRTLRLIVEQAHRATQIVTDLMDFAKPAPPRPARIPLVGLLEPLCQHWREASSLDDRQLRLTVADGTTAIYADPDQVREILQAVVANALEATEPETMQLQINSPSRASDETVRIVVKDNGAGMTTSVLEHALDPFFSSRPAGRGRGLGLSRAYRLAEINGGRLLLASTAGVGTTVTIEMPSRAAES